MIEHTIQASLCSATFHFTLLALVLNETWYKVEDLTFNGAGLFNAKADNEVESIQILRTTTYSYYDVFKYQIAMQKKRMGTHIPYWMFFSV